MALSDKMDEKVLDRKVHVHGKVDEVTMAVSGYELDLTTEFDTSGVNDPGSVGGGISSRSTKAAKVRSHSHSLEGKSMSSKHLLEPIIFPPTWHCIPLHDRSGKGTQWPHGIDGLCLQCPGDDSTRSRRVDG